MMLEFLGSWWGLGCFLALVLTIFFGPPFALAIEWRAERRETEEWLTNEPDPFKARTPR